MFAALHPNTWTLSELAISIVIIAAVVALVWVALKQFEIKVPDWVQQVFWIIVVAFVIILAIRLVMSF